MRKYHTVDLGTRDAKVVDFSTDFAFFFRPPSLGPRLGVLFASSSSVIFVDFINGAEKAGSRALIARRFDDIL